MKEKKIKNQQSKDKRNEEENDENKQEIKNKATKGEREINFIKVQCPLLSHLNVKDDMKSRPRPKRNIYDRKVTREETEIYITGIADI
jgi:hypothetical protein